MKKVIIAEELAMLHGMENSFLSRADIRLMHAETTDAMLMLHKLHMADLIIMPVDLGGSDIGPFCTTVREDAMLREVQMIIVCPNTRAAMEQASRCKPNGVVLRPVNPSVLLARAQQLLDVASRETYRVLINVSVDSTRDNTTFFCRSHDISTTGMLIETDRALPRGTSLKCSFFLPNSTRVQATAEVMRIVSGSSKDGVNRYGVRFVQISSRERSALEEFIVQKTVAR
jgi:DNA-binding response OmpR family regulator